MMKYDRQQAIHAAMDLFWEKGYQATTMRDLQQALDMRPGSIYACFGSKEGLFREVLHDYTQNSLTQLALHLTQAADPLAGLKTFFCASLQQGETARAERCRICLLTKVIAEIDQKHPELASSARDALGELEQALTEALTQARDHGQLPESADCKELACWLQMQMIGLRVYASIQPDHRRLEQMVQRVFDAIDGNDRRCSPG